MARITQKSCGDLFPSGGLLLSYCVEETIRFDVKASFVSRPVSRLVKLGDTTKEC